MIWRLPTDWILPPNEKFYTKFKNDGTLYSMTEPDFNIAMKRLSDMRTCIDVGAHIGTTTVRYAKYFDKVHSIEPVYFDILKKNIGYLDNVEFHKCIVSDYNGICEMVRSKGNSGATTVKLKENVEAMRKSVLGFDMKNTINVKSVTMDSMGFENVDFIKIDTEGVVLPVLKGSISTIKKYSPVLQIEFNKFSKKDECEKLLDELGYNFYEKYHVDHFYYKER